MEMSGDYSRLIESFSGVNYEKLRITFPQVNECIDLLSSIQGHVYQNRHIAAVSLTHRSALVFWPKSKAGIFSNERLEFFGDSFLNFYIAAEAMFYHPGLQEGELSRLRASLVGTKTLAAKSSFLGLGRCLLMGQTEAGMQENVLADLFEAVTAALLIDAGEGKVREWLGTVFHEDLRNYCDTLATLDEKGQLQQWIQGILGVHPTYKTIEAKGTPQDLSFVVGVFIGDTELARSTGKSKREASLSVARIVLDKILSHQITKEDILSYGQK